ncbi:MAG: peptidylprolyl isomerase [Bdellovibrionota bacterium]
MRRLWIHLRGARLFLLLTLVLCTLGAVARLAVADERVPKLSDERVIFHTACGDIVFAFYPEIAPAHQAQLEKLISLGVFNGGSFFRVVPSFIIQFSPYVDRETPINDTQREAIVNLPLEAGSLHHRRGVLSMAREDNDPNSGNVSFSILLGEAPHLDGKYTIFGEVVSGMDVVDTIVATPRDTNDKPSVPILVSSAEIVSADELGSRSLAPAHSIAPPNVAAVSKPGGQADSKRALQATLGVLLFLLALQVALDGRLSPRARRSLLAMEVLGGYFVLLIETVPDGQQRPALGLLLFLGLVAVFKIMGQFDSAK